MQEFLRFLSQGWVGTIVGAGGAALALFLYWRSQIPGMIAFQSHDVSMIGGGDAVFPVEVEVRYRGTSVPKLTSSTIWIWNAGKKTVRGSDVVAHDPFQFRFDGEVLPWCTTSIEAESSLGPDSHHPIISLSGIPSAVMVLRILHPILASTLCAANPLARIAEPTIAL